VGQTTLSPAYTDEEPREEIPGLCHLRHLFLRAEWHGTGLAAHLLDAAIDHARSEGYSRARLWTPRDNARARAFYRREGWHESGVELAANRFGMPLVQMVRDLG
jgi:GNAT superfamily N-acetyltransferase